MSDAIQFAIEHDVNITISPSEGVCTITLQKNGYAVSLEVDANDTKFTIDGVIYNAMLQLNEEIKKGDTRYEN